MFVSFRVSRNTLVTVKTHTFLIYQRVTMNTTMSGIVALIWSKTLLVPTSRYDVSCIVIQCTSYWGIKSIENISLWFTTVIISLTAKYRSEQWIDTKEINAGFSTVIPVLTHRRSSPPKLYILPHSINIVCGNYFVYNKDISIGGDNFL